MRNPLSTKELETQTRHHIDTAREILLTQGFVEPVGIVLDNNKTLNLISFDFSSEDNKKLSIAKFQLFIVKSKARAAWVIAETWLVIGHSINDISKCPPSENPDKMEAIIGIGSNSTDTVLTKFFFSRDYLDNPIPSDTVECNVMGEGHLPKFDFDTVFFPKKWEISEPEEDDKLNQLWNYFFNS